MDKPVVALLRQRVVADLRQRGVEIREADSGASQERLTDALRGMDVVVSCTRESATRQEDQISLLNAAKDAGVKRFVPCGFGTVASPGGIMRVRDQVG